MIVQFPTPYPDELLYSILGRYHMRSGNVFLKHTTEDLFGKRTVSATVFLPSNIHSLVSHLPENTALNEDVLIRNHTFFPFATVFLPENRANSIYQAMLSDSGEKIYVQSGLMASSIPQNKAFKFCPCCFREDLEQFGELYWHRLHQLPGQLLCLKHDLWLEDSKVPIINSNKHSYILPTIENCGLSKGRQVESKIYKQFVGILKPMENLLNGNYPYKSFSHFTNFYRKYLRGKGYTTAKGKVQQEELFEAFHEFYPDHLLKFFQVKLESKNSWLASITRKHRKSFHPYYHVLLLNFLDLNIEDVFTETLLNIDLLGNFHGACLNVICPDYNRDVIQTATIRRCEKTKEPIGRFTCPTCGFSYTKKGSALNDDSCNEYSRIMDFGSLWREELATLLGKDLSYREIARKLNVDTNTVIKYKEIIRSEDVADTQSNTHTIELLKSHRHAWLQLQKEHPNLSKTELRNLAPPTYAYLYRHDKEWLQNNSPIKRVYRSENKRVNWKKRDKEILRRVQMGTDELLSRKEDWIRITVKSLGDFIGERALLEQHLDKMPETKSYLQKVRESENGFRLRRVKSVLQEMHEAGEVIKTWSVLRRAGIKPKFEEEVKKFIQLNSGINVY
ncbi:TnsD family transposase [Neobacillus niacini]|uniref:TnsD family transposase n=1 Tax=Neobacillus niacini TaxID=86668 RepID=UPI002FFF6069